MKNESNKIELKEDEHYIIKDLGIEEILPNSFNNIVIFIIDGKHTVHIPSSVTGLQFKIWNKERGGILSKDVLSYCLNKKETAKYKLIVGKEHKYVIRLINEEEEPHFNTYNLVDGKLKDVSYMLLKKLNIDDKIVCTHNEEEEKDISIHEDTVISISKPKISEEDEFEHPQHPLTSISLFNE